MLISIKITANNQESLDNSLTSILIPQMENLSLATLGALQALYNRNVIQYFKDSYKSPNRQSYSDVFEKILKFLGVANSNVFIEQFSNGILKIEENKTWVPIQTAVDENGKKFSLTLLQFNNALEDLKTSAVI
jgi:hypothetical protein